MKEKRALEEEISSESNKKQLQEADPSCNTINQTNTSTSITLPEQSGEHTPTDKTNNVQLFNGIEISNLSKRQLKKYNKTLKWTNFGHGRSTPYILTPRLDRKKEKRAKERIKTKEKRLHAKLNNIDLGPSRKELKRIKMKESPCKIGVCIDLSFDDLMINKDMAKTIKQILRVYTQNRRAKHPMQLHLTSFDGRSKEEMSRHHGYENWDINFHAQNYLEVFKKESLIYLSSESDNVITELEENKVYIIGGLVDHNSHKGICHDKAVKQGIAHGRLPIGEYFWMKHRKVLTINQVFEILLRVSEGKSFKEAFELILPKRIEKISMEKESIIPTNEEADETSD